MGRIKTKAVKRASTRLIARDPEMFSTEFDVNKKILGKEMPSKKVRNMIAGYIGRLKKHNKKIIQEN
jgi:ribosomal protein S17E